MGRKRFAWYIGMMIAGAILLAVSVLVQMDSFWTWLGAVLAAMSVMRLALLLRWRNNEEAEKEIRTRNQDERNLFLAEKARSWTLYIGILLMGVGTILFRATGQEIYSNACACFLSVLVVIYWIAYLILKQKY